MLRFIRIFTIFLIILTAAWLLVEQPQSTQTTNGNHSEASIGGDFSLLDQDGNTVTNQSLKGKPRLVYFGFTYCPDICPTALLSMSAAARRLGDDAPQLIFISVDPERDTVDHLKEYAENFPGVLALTGSAESVKQAAQAYRVYYRKTEKGQDDGTYLVDHSSFIYLMDDDGNYLTHFPHTAPPDKLAEGIATALQP